MDNQGLEKRYMEKSWKEEKHQAYKNENIDGSVIKFYRFLTENHVKGKLLDVGCGNGKNTIFFQDKGFDSTGIDFSASAIDICKENALKKDISPKFIAEDALRYSSPERYDAIIDCGCLHHIRKSHWKRYKSTIMSNLKENGFFYLHGISDCEENKRLPRHPKKKNWMVNGKGHYTHFFSEEEIRREFKDLSIIKTYQFKSKNSPLMIRAFYMQKEN